MRFTISYILFAFTFLFLSISVGNSQTISISCPSDTIVTNSSLSCDYLVDDFTGLVSIANNNGIQSLQQDITIGSPIGLGDYLITITVKDNSNKSASCTFKITVIDTLAPQIICPKDTIAVVPDLVLSDTLTLCGAVIQYQAPQANDNCSIASILQIDGTGYTSGDIFPKGVTIQTYKTTDGSGNTATCSFYIHKLATPIPEILNNKLTLCGVDNVILNANEKTGGTGTWIVKKGGATLANPNDFTTKASNLSYGTNTFIWKVTTPQCGSDSDTISIEVSQLPSDAETTSSITLCTDTLANVIANHPTVGVGHWTSVTGNVQFVDATVINTDASNFEDGVNNILWIVENGSCPPSIDTLQIYTTEKAKIFTPDTTVCLEDNNFSLIGSSATGKASASWYSASKGVEMDNKTTFSPTITELEGGKNIIIYGITHPTCGSSADTLVIIGKQCKEYNPLIPTLITPNGDGKNDLFIIDNLNTLYPNSTVVIANRWGNLVFESDGYANPWDGTYKEKTLPVGTYFYRVILNDAKGTEITGSISIIR